MTMKDNPDLCDALDGLMNAVRYCESRDLEYGEEISDLYQKVGEEAPDEDWETEENIEEEIQENIEERIEIAVDLLEQHPHVVETWSTPVAREFGACFKQVCPDTDTIEIMLELEEYGTWWINSDERQYVEDNGLVVEREWDVHNKYFYLEKDGEEVPFTEWSDDYEWDIGSWQQTVEEFLEEAGWEKND